MKKSYKTTIILIFLITILTLYLLNSNLVIESILDYTKLFITKLFPTSFLLYIISNLLINYQIIEHISKFTKSPATFYVIIISMICGFPSGPKHIKDLHEKNYLSQSTANFLLRFTHFPNPLFILGSISTITSKPLAIKILISLLLSNIIIAISTHKKETSILLPSEKQEVFSKSLSKAIISSFQLQLLIYGTNIFFYLISVIITNYIQTTPLFFIIINGSLDLIKGIFSTTLLKSSLLKSLLIILFTSLGSISIHIQIKSILSDTSLKYKTFIEGRFISTILAIIIFSLIYKL